MDARSLKLRYELRKKQSSSLDRHWKRKLASLYEFPFGIQELEGVAYRGAYDLTKHQEHSGKNIEYFDEETKERFEGTIGSTTTLSILMSYFNCIEVNICPYSISFQLSDEI